MWVVNNRKIFYTFSGLLVAASLVALFVFGLKPSIDFTGGTLIDVQYQAAGAPDQNAISAALAPIDPQASVRPSGQDEYIVRMKPIDEAGKVQVYAALHAVDVGQSRAASSTASAASSVASSSVAASSAAASSTASESVSTASPIAAVGTVKSFDSVGPVLGAEAIRRAYVSVILVLIGIILFITFAFRKVSEPVQSWKYGVTAIIGLIHNVLIPIGVFVILGSAAGYEVDTLFVTALLVILGFSVHDTIVVFDRVRENLRLQSEGRGLKKPFAEVVGMSISQTFTRSVNTSLTTLIALIVLYILGGSSTQHFALALIIGIAAGTYSSIFIGSPFLVTIEKWGKGE